MASASAVCLYRYEILSCDWNKYNDCVLATGSVDKTARIWVRRAPRCALRARKRSLWKLARLCPPGCAQPQRAAHDAGGARLRGAARKVEPLCGAHALHMQVKKEAPIRVCYELVPS